MSAHGYGDDGVSASDLSSLPGAHAHQNDAHVKMDVVGSDQHTHQTQLDVSVKAQEHQLLGLQLLHGIPTQSHLEASLGADHGLRDDSFASDESGEGLGKRGLVDEVLNSSLSNSYTVDIDVAPDRKKRKTLGEAQQKRYKYDVLKAFFKVYFREDCMLMVMKDAMYTLYTKKIPADARIARNAMYRHMWSHFKDKISSFQSNYREYIKGIAMVSATWPRVDLSGLEKEVEVLQSLGVTELYDLDEDDLMKESKEKHPLPPSAHSNANTTTNPPTNSNTTSFGGTSPSQYMAEDTSNTDTTQLLNFIEGLENTAKNLLQSLKELKAKIKKKNGTATTTTTSTLSLSSSNSTW